MAERDIKMTKTKTIIDSIVKSIAAAMMISIASFCNLVCENRYVGAFLFAFGLIVICKFCLNLFTGIAGYITFKNLHTFLIALIVNLVTAFGLGALMSYNAQAVTRATEICSAKMNMSLLSLFISSVFCGIMIYLGVEYYKKHSSLLGIIFAIPIFVICGFDHAVADIFYYGVAGQYNVADLLLILIVVVGNIVGSNIVRFLFSDFLKIRVHKEQ